MIRTCNQCGITSDMVRFVKYSKPNKYKLRPECVPCNKENSSLYYLNNREKLDIKHKEWAINNPERYKYIIRKADRKRKLKKRYSN